MTGQIAQPEKTSGVPNAQRNRAASPGSAVSLPETDAAATAEPALPLDETAGTPEDIWFDYFAKRQPSPRVIRDTVLKLHDAGKHEHVIASIQAALVHGQSQPWMYDVLALSLEIAGRPREEVERAIYSGIDLTGADFQSMMVSAAYLTRFDREQAALHLYRQASKVAKTRPEPYIMALPLARRTHDAEAIRWAASGILTYAWTAGHQQLHKQAEAALLDSEDRLRQAGDNAAAEATRDARIAALQRDLILMLTWNGVGDLDLIVEEPTGTVCSFDNPLTEGGGVLVHDGYGPEQDNCFEQYVCAFGVPGTYKIRVRHAWGQVVGARAKLKIIRYQGTPHESVREFTVPLQEDDAIVRVELGKGRREELAEVYRDLSPRTGTRRRSLLQMVGRLDAESRRSARRFQDSRTTPGTGFTPLITTVREGVTLSATAVVSGDRRYVRITAAPVFNNITDVFTFTFSGPNAGTTGGGPVGNPGGAGPGN